ncbi:MAG: hypothetical protein ACK5TO_16985, partial [Planctomycetaceae bacterium]
MKFQSWANLIGRLFFQARVKASLRRRQMVRTRRMSRSQVAEALESRALLAVTTSVSGNQLQISLDAANDQVWISYSSSSPTSEVGNLQVGTSSSNLTNKGTFGPTGTTAAQINSIMISDTSGSAGQQVFFAGSNPISGTGAFFTGLSSGVSITGVETINVRRLIRGGGANPTPLPATVVGNASTVNLTYTTTGATATRLQQAVDFAASGGAVSFVNAGQYNQSVTINKALNLDGFGSTVPSATTGTRINVASGTAITLGENADGSTLRELRVSGSVVNNTVGVGLQAGAQVDNLTLVRVAAASQGTGFLIPATAGAAGLTITNSNFSNNDRAIAALADTNISTNESGLTGAS